MNTPARTAASRPVAVATFATALHLFPTTAAHASCRPGSHAHPSPSWAGAHRGLGLRRTRRHARDRALSVRAERTLRLPLTQYVNGVQLTADVAYDAGLRLSFD